jgi:hypothetical protein
MVLRVACVIAATLSVAACTDYESTTNLNPEGPPMIRQVRMTENYLATPTATTVSTRKVFAFGTHPVAFESEQHPVTAATAEGNALRIIIDELLVGNNLQEIACRGQVDADSFSRVPRGATPDDIMKCSAAQDVLPALCKGDLAVCICQNAGGCPVGSTVVPKDGPVGVLDNNQDGSADIMRFIEGAVGVQCGPVDVPIDLEKSYWNPSGNQQRPAMGGFDALGPAIVLVPRAPFPTNLDCHLKFGADVVDKQGIAVCAPVDGEVDAGCAPGEVTAFKFHTELLAFSLQEFKEGATGVNRILPILLGASVPIDTTTLSGITLWPTMSPMSAVAVTITSLDKNIFVNIPAPGLDASTEYTLTVPRTVLDTYGQPAPGPTVFHFTTTSM